MTLVRGTFVHCPKLGELDILDDHLLGVDDAGFITYIGPATSTEAIQMLGDGEDVTIIPEGSFLLPTFCDLHLHAPQFLYQGTGLHLPLMQWLDEYAFKAEEKLDADPGLARKVYERLAARLVEAGTGAVLLFGTIREETNLILAEVMQAAGIRAFVGKLSMDISSRPSYREASAQASLASAASFVHGCRSQTAHLPPHVRLVQPVITPRFVPTCSNELLAALGELAETEGLAIQSHMSEARIEIEWVQQERGMEDMDVFEQNKLLTPRTIQAHCTFLSPAQLTRLSSLGSAVAHCPLSNAYFSERPFPLREALQAEVTVGLGTDVAGGYSIDIMSAMRQAVVVSRMREGARKEAGGTGDGEQVSVDWKETLYMATRGGARALGLQGGLFEVGAPFDVQQIQMHDPATASGIGALDFFGDAGQDGTTVDLRVLEMWWCLGDVRNRKGMWVQGRRLKMPI